jgi:serine/threonine-protein kinase
VHEDLEYRWAAGEAVRVETYQGRYPELRDDLGAALSLIAAEYDQRRQRGEGCAPEEYRQRFPQYGAELVSRLQACGARHETSAPVPEAAPDDLTPVGESPPETVHELTPVTATAKGRSGWPTVPGYEILGELGQGGMGEVYKARHLALQRLVALKLLRAGLRGQSELEGRFLEEAQLTGQLQHPGIPPVHEVGVLADGRPFLAMKLIQGRTLGELLQERPGPAADLPRFLAIFEQVCQTLAYAHARGVIHRDLKPDNIMVGAFGEVQVMDWGLAKVLRAGRSTSAGSAADTDPLVTVRTASAGLSSQAGALLGTPAYMAPEQARGEVDQLDERCDVFGLGAMLCELLTGQPPYRGGLGEVLLQAERGDLGDALARLEASGAEAPLVQLARACLAGPKEDRPRHAGEVSQTLSAYLAGVQERLQEAERERAAAEARAVEERKRRRLAVALAGVVLLLVLLAAGGAWWYQRVEADRAERQARTEREVTQAVGEAKALSEQARGLGTSPDEREKTLGLALSAAKRAQGLLGAGEVGGRISPGLRDQVQELNAELAEQAGRARRAAERAAKDRRMRTELERIRLEQTVSRAGEFDKQAALPLYAAVFREYGIDVESLPEGKAAAAIAASAIKEELLAALDEWALRRPDSAGKERLTHVAQAVEQDSRGFGHRLRKARLQGDTAELKRLARDADVPRLPATTVVHLAEALRQRGERAAAVEVLKATHVHHPGDFWVNHDLGMSLWDDDPQHLEQVAGYFRAALAARPNSPGMYLRLGVVLKRQGRLDEAIALCRKAIELDPTYSASHNNLGNALKVKGELGEAIKEFHHAIRLDPKNALAYRNLGDVLLMQGKPVEAEAAYRKALDLKPNSDEAYYAYYNLGGALLQQAQFNKALTALKKGADLLPAKDSRHEEVRQFVQKCQRLVILDAKLPGVLRGAEKPANAAEQIEFAELCGLKKLAATAARLSRDAFAADPKLAETVPSGARYNAACYAALAGCGQGRDADKLDGQERARWRRQALHWLRADLTWWGKALDKGNAQAKAEVQPQMRHWQTDADLAGVRDKEALAKLPAEERQQWQQLWADVAALLRRSAATP